MNSPDGEKWWSGEWWEWRTDEMKIFAWADNRMGFFR
jgi:hypothetical protein